MIAPPAEPTAVDRFRLAESALFDSLGLHPKSHEVLAPHLGATVRILEFGEGPPVLLLPGLGAVAAAWSPLVARLGGIRLLAVDRPGCGLSGPFDLRGLDLRRWATTLVHDLVDALGLDRVSVIGNSIGGTTALWYAIEHPEQVDRMVLIGAPPFVLDTQAPLPMRALSIPFVTRLSLGRSAPKDVADVFVRMGHPPDVLSPEMLETVMAARELPGYVDGFIGILHNATGLFGRRVEARAEELGSIVQPTLMIWGRRDTHGPVATGERMAQTMRRATLEVVDGGHLPWLDEPARCAELVNSFMR